MDISQDEIYDYVFKLLSTSDDIDSLTMRKIIDGFQEKYGLDSIEKEMKSEVRKTVDQVYSRLNEKEGDEIDTKKTPVKSNIQEYPQTKSKRKRDGSSEESNRNSADDKRKKDNKKQKIEHNYDSDDSVKISLEENSSRKSYEKASTHQEQSNQGNGKKNLNGKHKRKEDSSDDSDLSDEKSENEKNEILVVKEKQNMMKAKGSSEKKYAVDTTDSSDNQMSEGKSTSSKNKPTIVGASDSKEQRKKKQKNTTKKLKKTNKRIEDDSDISSSEDDFENVSVTKKDKMTTKNDNRSPVDNKSDDKLASLKSKLKNFEDSVDTKGENQKRNSDSSSSDDDDDKRSSTKSSGESASGKKQSRGGRAENESGDDEKFFDKKKKRGSYVAGKEDLKSSRKEREDSSKLKNLKRYLRACGMHQNYIKFFEECRSMTAKERKLEEHIREVTGIEGRFTLEKCKKYKLKKEEADELAELDVSKIIGTPEKGKRVTRQSSSCSVSRQAFTPSPVGKGVFSNLRDLLDSDESENEKRERKTKKTIVLESDEDKEDNIQSGDSGEGDESEDEDEGTGDERRTGEENKILKKMGKTLDSSEESD
ncbi:HIRA-interacting protein 3-like isoform X2 [Dendronephthya gigantea]|uniref:HIRA-interacting protein 3-like isoform X2 n=1 Tax=Dendronephthya gigantea TaxID=151771 RepID=UPI00106A45D1|nr:HIRA-interacting protein 3-like isoform X2 [Dendronephthya gigantea]